MGLFRDQNTLWDNTWMQWYAWNKTSGSDEMELIWTPSNK